jgi:hypothetical protein
MREAKDDAAYLGVVSRWQPFPDICIDQGGLYHGSQTSSKGH